MGPLLDPVVDARKVDVRRRMLENKNRRRESQENGQGNSESITNISTTF